MVQELLDELAQTLFISSHSPIQSALGFLRDGSVLRVRAPGGCIAGQKRDGEISIIGPEEGEALFEIHFVEPDDLRRFTMVGSALEFGEVFSSMAAEGRIKLEMLMPFLHLWEMGVGLFLKEIGVLSAPDSYSELIEPLQLRDIAFTEILDVKYLQELVDELARIIGVRLWILDMNSMPVVVSSTGGEHCQLIIDSLQGVTRCYGSSIEGLAALKEAMAPRVRKCHAGFICFDAPLILGGEMVGMISGDASITEAPDKDYYRELARELGIDPEPLLDSLEKVRKVDMQEAEFLLSVVNAIAQVVSEMSFKQYQLADLSNELRHKNIELKALFQAITDIQERERSAIARDLHDDTGQNLSNALVNLEMALGEAGGDRDLIAHLESASNSISAVLKQLHNLSASLHPPLLDDLGLTEALRNLVRRMNADHDMEFRLVARGEEAELPGEVKINLYRIAQEATSNIIKHSGASKALVYFYICEESADLMITDDGIGIRYNAEDDGEVHLGFVSMRERAEQMGGSFQLSSSDQGLTLAIHVPLRKA
jgi:signal transduction histidine kinase